MKALCNSGTIDIDVLNQYSPSEDGPFVQCDVGSYKLDTLSEKEFGTFLRTDDNGAVFFQDVVFKILMDMAIKAKLPAAKYLHQEVLRGNASRIEIKDNSEDDATKGMTRPDMRKSFGKLLKEHGVKNVLLGDCSRVVPFNFKVLDQSDMIHSLCPNPAVCDPAYIDACIQIVEFLDQHLYLGNDIKSFWALHSALFDLFCTYDTDDVKLFLDNFYEILDKIPDVKYTKRTAGTLGCAALPAREHPITSAGSEDEITDTVPVKNEDESSDSETINSSDNNQQQEFRSRKLKLVNGSDITGLDETYAAGYREAFYDREIEQADSEGFLEKLIIARANETAAPIDLLSEAIESEHKKDTAANLLRKNMEMIREDIQEAIGHEDENISSDENNDESSEETV